MISVTVGGSSRLVNTFKAAGNWRILLVEISKCLKGVKNMNPFVISAILRIFSNKRVCPACKKGQIVSSEQKGKSVTCKYCGEMIPARSNRDSFF